MKLNDKIGRLCLSLLLGLILAQSAGAESISTQADKLSLSMRDTDLSDVMSMLSRQQRVNILLSNDVEANVSFSLYEVTLDEAISSIASAAGYAVEQRDGNYFIVEHESTGKYAPNGLTEVRSFEIQYADASVLSGMLTPYLSSYGELTILEDRRLVVVEDTPEFITRIAKMLAAIDRKPRQILIEAQILEITLDDEDAFGIDWKKLFDSDGGSGSFGTTGLSADEASGFFFDLATPDIEVALDALRSSGRVRTLSTPKLLALENQESEVLIGDRKGYRVTTTINQVTSESIEFLESGVILRVTPSIDADRAIMLDIHPEVSTGTVDASGIPSQTTTEVTTQLLVSDGQSVFIGGLLKHTLTESRAGVPVLSSVPGIKRLFSNRRKINVNTETIVLITPHIVDDPNQLWNTAPEHLVDSTRMILDGEQQRIGKYITNEFPAVNSLATHDLDDVIANGGVASIPDLQLSTAVQTRGNQYAPVARDFENSSATTQHATAEPAIIQPETIELVTVQTVTAETRTPVTVAQSASTIVPVAPTHFVKPGALRVRFGPQLDAGVRSVLYSGHKVRVLNFSGEWSRVTYVNLDGTAREGWMMSRFLEPI